MAFVRDDHAYTRGAGAIASVDRQKSARRRVLESRRAARAVSRDRVAYAVTRGALGLINLNTDTPGGGAALPYRPPPIRIAPPRSVIKPSLPTITRTGSGTVYSPTRSPTISALPNLPTISAPRLPVSPTSPIGSKLPPLQLSPLRPGMPGTFRPPGPVVGPIISLPGAITPPTQLLTPSSPDGGYYGGGGGGGGGGGSSWDPSLPDQSAPDDTDDGSDTGAPSSSAPAGKGKKVGLILGGLGLAWLLFGGK